MLNELLVGGMLMLTPSTMTFVMNTPCYNADTTSYCSASDTTSPLTDLSKVYIYSKRGEYGSDSLIATIDAIGHECQELSYTTTFPPGYMGSMRVILEDRSGNRSCRWGGLTFVIPYQEAPIDTNLHGLQGNYYNNSDFTGTIFLRVDPTINFNWAYGSPDPSMSNETFSAKWFGFVVPTFSELYTFYINSDDGSRLFIDGNLLIDNWGNHGATERSGTIQMVAGSTHELRLEYYEDTGEARMEMRWSSPSTPKQIIPATSMHP